MPSPAYESFRSASRASRQEKTVQLMHAMHDGDHNAHEQFYEICSDVIQTQDIPPDDPERPIWIFPAEDSVQMIRVVPRVSGYLRAIARTPDVRHAIDAGAGSTAIFSLGAVALQPALEKVTAYEINEGAVRCARAVIELCGMEEYVTVVEGNVLEADLPEADVGITETFMAGLAFEQGHKITAALARSCREVLPARATIWAVDDDYELSLTERRGFADYQPAGTVDFTAENDMFTGTFSAVETGDRLAWVVAGFYDTRGDAVIGPFGGSLITNPIPLGDIHIERPGQQISFQYKLGSDLTDPAPRIWLD